jgi:hypothetical protein
MRVRVQLPSPLRCIDPDQFLKTFLIREQHDQYNYSESIRIAFQWNILSTESYYKKESMSYVQDGYYVLLKWVSVQRFGVKLTTFEINITSNAKAQ